MIFFRKKNKPPRFNVEINIIEKEISRSKRFGFQFGVLIVEVSHRVPRGLSKLLPGKTISFHLLERHIRNYDTIVPSLRRRYYIILPQTDKKGVNVVKERIKKLAEKYGWGAMTIGAVVYPNDGENAEKLLNTVIAQTAV